MNSRRAASLKVLFLQPPSPPRLDVLRDFAGGFGTAEKCERPDFGHTGTPMPYMPFLYAAGRVRETGFEVAFLDGQALHLDKQETLSRVQAVMPDIVAISLSLPSLEEDLEFAIAIRGLLPDCRIIAGGTVAKVLTEKILRSSAIDFAVVGFEEETIPKVVDMIAGADTGPVEGTAALENGRLTKTVCGQPPDLNNLSLPPYDLLPLDGYRSWEFPLEKSFLGVNFGRQRRYFPLFLSRGCSFACGYCPYPLGFGDRVRVRSEVSALAEIEHLYNNHGIDAFIFRDQNFTLSRKRVERLCRSIATSRMSIMWSCETRVDLVDKQLLKVMRNAGCRRIFFGVETGDKEVFQQSGKPGVHYEQIKLAFKLCRRYGITPCAHVMVGIPGESGDSARITEQLLRRIGASQGNCSVATPYPGTEFYQQMLAEDNIKATRWSEFTGNDPVMDLPDQSMAQIREAKEYLRAYFRTQERNSLRKRFGSLIKPSLRRIRQTIFERRDSAVKTGVIGE